MPGDHDDIIRRHIEQHCARALANIGPASHDMHIALHRDALLSWQRRNPNPFPRIVLFPRLEHAIWQATDLRNRVVLAYRAARHELAGGD